MLQFAIACEVDQKKWTIKSRLNSLKSTCRFLAKLFALRFYHSGKTPRGKILGSHDRVHFSVFTLPPPTPEVPVFFHSAQGVQPPTFSYFLGFLLLFPTFWLLKAKFLLIFCNFLEILQLFFDFVSKICNFPVNFEDFRKFLFNFEIFEPCSVIEIVNKAIC